MDLRVGTAYDLSSSPIASIGDSQQKTWDDVQCHQVLSHLARTLDAVRALHAKSKLPGGIVAIREAFIEGLKLYPPLKGI